MIRCFLILLILISPAWASPALAHSWYPQACCGGEDCKPVPCAEIVALEHGWMWNKIFFERSVLHPSEDGGCHVCINRNNTAFPGTCIFLRPET